ncbi:MAG: ABC transporter permease subunit [Lonepinella koalarum]|nr:ABC transporter permease subunit [Lonepinella koalarum]
MLDKEPEDFRHTNRLREIWQLLQKDKLSLICFYVFFGLILTALFAPYLSPYATDRQFVELELLPPSWSEKGTVSHFFGTDDIGRDLLSRLIQGVTYTFGSATIIVIFTALIGGLLGILAGMSKGIKSRILGHFLDSFLVIPVLLIAIIIATLMDAGLINAMLAIMLALLPQFIHDIHDVVKSELKKEYVLTLRLEGINDNTLLKSTILPNILVPYIRQITRAFTIAILDISALSFISLGAQHPTPEWGAMIRENLDLIYLAPWNVILPGLAIVLTMLVVIILGNGLCKAIEKYDE